MIFHIFFVTVSIKKREYTEKDIQREMLRKYSQDVKRDTCAKQMNYFRLI